MMKIIPAKVAEQEVTNAIVEKQRQAIESFNTSLQKSIAEGKRHFLLHSDTYSLVAEEIKEAGYTITPPKNGYDPYFGIEF